MSADALPLARELHQARAQARQTNVDPAAVRSVADAYSIQSELIRLSGTDVRGWKVTGLVPADQAKFQTTRAVAGALLEAWVQDAPGELALSRSIAPLIECEIAFLLGADLPPKSTPYSRSEVEAAIAAVLPAFEFPDGRTPADSPDLVKLADVMNNGAFVAGPALRDWRGIDLRATAITLWRDGQEIATGSGAQIPGGDPLMAVVALANAQPLPAPLRAGQIVTTGTCTPPLPVQAGLYRAAFDGLGEITLRIVA